MRWQQVHVSQVENLTCAKLSTAIKNTTQHQTAMFYSTTNYPIKSLIKTTQECRSDDGTTNQILHQRYVTVRA